jgi:hypothetical protein
MQGSGLLVLGAAGTGKSHWLRGVVAALHQAGTVVQCCVAVQNLGVEGCTTADHWVRKHIRAGGVHCSVLVVEEFTQINCTLWADIALCRMKGVSVICCGDFKQFAACMDSWAGCAIPEDALEHSAMLLEMCGGNRLTLTENKRSDPKLFDFYTNLSNLEADLARAKELFPRTDRPAAYTLTMSRARRMAINRQRNEQELAQFVSQAVFIQAPPATRAGNQPQDMHVWPGLQLIGHGGFGVKKGLWYTVAEVSGESVILEGGIRLTHEQASKSLRLAYAITYASCQGLTLRGVVRLETTSPNFTLRHLYVGISRATAADLAEVV